MAKPYTRPKIIFDADGRILEALKSKDAEEYLQTVRSKFADEYLSYRTPITPTAFQFSRTYANKEDGLNLIKPFHSGAGIAIFAASLGEFPYQHCSFQTGVMGYFKDFETLLDPGVTIDNIIDHVDSTRAKIEAKHPEIAELSEALSRTQQGSEINAIKGYNRAEMAVYGIVTTANLISTIVDFLYTPTIEEFATEVSSLLDNHSG